jgi:polynucleotide 5'-hydroxyl-kinase GRC3/NOL9
MVKGELELPILGMLDFRRADDEIGGGERGQMPFFLWGERRRGRRGAEEYVGI